MTKIKELTSNWRDEAALGLNDGSIGQENESPIQLSILPSDILHQILPTEFTHTPADLLSPTQVTSNW